MVLAIDQIMEAHRLHLESIDERDEKKLEKSRDIYLALLNEYPDQGQVLFGLGTVYLQQGCHGLACNLLKRASLYNPAAPEVWNNIGSCYKAEQKNDMAETYYLLANSIRECPDYLNNLATLYVNEGEPEQGIIYARKALEMDPYYAKAAWNLALMELESGNWAEGFKLYLAGIDSGDRLIKTYSKVSNETGEAERVPFWDGQKGANVVVYGEQGLGDEIMFASCIEDLAKDCKTVIFDCHPRLIETFKRSFAHIENIIAYYPDRKREGVSWEEPHELDYAVPIGNLPFHYRSSGEFPRTAYLKPNPEKVQMYREYMESLGDGPYVGIGWIGGYKRTHSNHRCSKLGHFKPVMEKGGTFISLQYTDVTDKVARFNAETGLNLHHDPDLLATFDYDETVALLAALDLVICVNTTVAHVCGAIGQPCWTLTPYQRAWRYPGEGGKMYQYGDWVDVIHKGKEESWPDMLARVADQYESWLESR